MSAICLNTFYRFNSIIPLGSLSTISYALSKRLHLFLIAQIEQNGRILLESKQLGNSI